MNKFRTIKHSHFPYNPATFSCNYMHKATPPSRLSFDLTDESWHARYNQTNAANMWASNRQ